MVEESTARFPRTAPSGEPPLNENFKELKARIRTLTELVAARGQGSAELAQAVSAVQRAERRGDRSRDPSPQLRSLLEDAEAIARVLTGQA